MDNFLSRVRTLTHSSIEKHRLAFNRFEWPEKIQDDMWWHSPDALSIATSAIENDWSEEQKMALAKWECINIFSLNYTGELELMQEVSRIMHEVKLGEAKEYLHHLIDEENQHMWYFNKFCQTYAGKVYPSKKIQLEKQKLEKPMDHFLVFARVLIFEEIGHYFNVVNARDKRVEPFIREINEAHYHDEARHIAFGRQVLEQLAEDAIVDDNAADFVENQLDKSIAINIGSIYNPQAYRDAGFPQGVLLREKLLNDPSRMFIHEKKMLSGVKRLLGKCGLNVMEETAA
ncbi:hypothetical protein TDB9533_00889 [Thalassocella blandensis]|nr:hypothetical protein TDB9533_00889 [Thalassocella blandensis]